MKYSKKLMMEVIHSQLETMDDLRDEIARLEAARAGDVIGFYTWFSSRHHTNVYLGYEEWDEKTHPSETARLRGKSQV